MPPSMREVDARKRRRRELKMYYSHKNVEYARELRKNMTPWERKLWYMFLSKYKPRFQRQKPIDNYIVDFYCAKAKLAIELDGGGHYNASSMQKDSKRTENLQKNGITILRFCNLDIDKHFYEVCTVIDQEVKVRILPQSATLTASSKRGPGGQETGV